MTTRGIETSAVRDEYGMLVGHKAICPICGAENIAHYTRERLIWEPREEHCPHYTGIYEGRSLFKPVALFA